MSSKKCEDDKILNPKTNRYVKKNGLIGRKILEKNKNRSRKSRIRRSRSVKSRIRKSRRALKSKKLENVLNSVSTDLILADPFKVVKHHINYDDIYLNTTRRSEILNIVKNELKDISKIYGTQCITGDKAELLKKIQVNDILGIGTFGNVYEGCLPKPCDEKSYKFAIKLSAFIKKNHYKNPFNPEEHSWHEYFILKDYIKPLIEKGVCPNLPLLLEAYLCENCEFIGGKNGECIITLTELAVGDLYTWFKKDRTVEEVSNALFQIMAGLHAIQYHCQIVNKDIKASNVLYYNVKPGGYWEYTIHGKKFYLPNLGYIFVLNDFGVSLVLDPLTRLKKSKTQDWVGLSRQFMIINNQISPFEGKTYWEFKNSSKNPNDKKDSSKILPKINWYSEKIGDNFVPILDKLLYRTSRCIGYINVKTHKIKSCDIQFTDEQLFALNRLDIPADCNNINFYLHPEIIPPIEFASDVQDCIRIFTGGPRISSGFSKTDHHEFNIPTEFKHKLLNYLNLYIRHIETLGVDQLVNPATYVAGYFIDDFYTNHYNLSKRPSSTSDIIQVFNIS